MKPMPTSPILIMTYTQLWQGVTTSTKNEESEKLTNLAWFSAILA
jgi:hypothetical protein